ncbi:MAG: L,D-transpeptidase, partial [Okeania sp. SIO2D1]|nr:L,D-transpeptidase [Okeania sp. SIO2D1]
MEVEKLIQVVLRLGERRVYVYEGEEEIASYPVAVG